MRRGEVWWADLPSGRRPVMILTRDAAIQFLSKVAVVPATRTSRGIPTEIRLGPGDGMRDECVLTTDDVRTIRKSALRNKITALPEARVDEVCDALAYAFGCV